MKEMDPKDLITKDLLVGLMGREDFLDLIGAQFSSTTDFANNLGKFYKDLRRALKGVPHGPD